MKGFKKGGISLVALALSTSITSQEGFYAEGSDSFLDTLPYALSTPTIPPFSATFPITFIPHDFEYFYNHPEENWGYQITLGYDMPSCDPCCNYGVRASYTNFESDQSRCIMLKFFSSLLKSS